MIARFIFLWCYGLIMEAKIYLCWKFYFEEQKLVSQHCKRLRENIFLANFRLAKSPKVFINSDLFSIYQSYSLKRQFFHACTGWIVWPTTLPPRIHANRPHPTHTDRTCRTIIHALNNCRKKRDTHWAKRTDRDTRKERRRSCFVAKVFTAGCPSTNQPNNFSSGRIAGSSIIS